MKPHGGSRLGTFCTNHVYILEEKARALSGEILHDISKQFATSS